LDGGRICRSHGYQIRCQTEKCDKLLIFRAENLDVAIVLVRLAFTVPFLTLNLNIL